MRWYSGERRGSAPAGLVGPRGGVALAVAAAALGAVYVAPGGADGTEGSLEGVQERESVSDALQDAPELSQEQQLPGGNGEVVPDEAPKGSTGEIQMDSTPDKPAFDEITISVPGDITLFSPHVPVKSEIVSVESEIETVPLEDAPKPSKVEHGVVEDAFMAPPPHHDVQIIDTEGICLAIPVPPKETEAETQPPMFEEGAGEINWDSPSFGGLPHGNCGPEFRTAFACFVHSKTEPKGADCTRLFNLMQDCFANTATSGSPP